MGDGTSDGIERLLADLEQQAQGLHLRERDDEIAELLPAEVAGVTLDERVHASVGRTVRVQLFGGLRIQGVLAEAGRGWFALDVGSRQWCVMLGAVHAIRGLGRRALVETARPLSARLGPGTPLRDFAERRVATTMLLRDGARIEGLLAQVGADFVEVAVSGPGGNEVVPFEAMIAALAERG